MDSKIGLIIQLAGVSLITLLTLFLRRSLNVVALKHWTNAWLFLSCSLFCLRLAFSYEVFSTQLFSFYFLTEYFFGFFLIAGCRSLTGNKEMKVRQEIFVLAFIAVAFGLPFLADDFNLVFNLHSLILAGFFAIAFVTLLRTKIRSFGGKVMLIALGLLACDFFQYFIVFSLRQYTFIVTDYLAYNSVVDLVLQMLLGFGMVIVLLEQVLVDAKSANEKLQKAHKKLEQLDRRQLDQSDQVLLKKALDLARQIATTPDMTEEQAMKSQSPADILENHSPAYASLLTRAKNALADPIR